MKKSFALILALIFILSITGCSSNKGGSADNKTAFFIAKAIEINDSYMLVEVTDKGNCGISDGGRVSVSTDKISGLLANDPSFVKDNYIRVEFDGTVMETYPEQLGEIFKIDVVDEKGISVE